VANKLWQLGERSVHDADATAASNVAEGEDPVRAHRIYTRRTEARELREEAAELAFLRRHRDHINNGEEAAYRRPNGELSYIANYSKALRHNSLGEVTRGSYRSLLRALHSGNPDHFEQIRLGLPDGLDLTNPQSGLAFDLEGPDAQAVTMPPAPRIDSRENSAEMGELYWMALLRDVRFIHPTGGDDYRSNATVGDAAASLSELSVGPPRGDFSDFRGPRDAVGNVTRDTLFRGFTRGDLVGPYVSQFLLMGNEDPALGLTPAHGFITYGTLKIDQRQRTVLSPAVGGSDFLTTFSDWLAVQDGDDRTALPLNPFDGTQRFIRNLRDLANYVHFDALYEAHLNACLILLSIPAPFDPGNPYVASRTQDGFGTFGPPHILTLLTEVATRTLKAEWFQKWFVHRRLRPEEFGGRIEVHRPGGVAEDRYEGMIDEEILNSSVLAQIIGQFGTALLPQVFPEGAPTHPSYGAGHASVAGACVTILKAWFDESFVLPGPVLVPDADGTALVPLTSVTPAVPPVQLTVGGELNKLAANIAIGRNAAGVHWRSDYTGSVKLGEEIAIRILQEQRPTYNEDHHFSLTKFDGTAITI
jgi:membrane-associated phospholipid phosphatase